MFLFLSFTLPKHVAILGHIKIQNTHLNSAFFISYFFRSCFFVLLFSLPLSRATEFLNCFYNLFPIIKKNLVSFCFHLITRILKMSEQRSRRSLPPGRSMKCTQRPFAATKIEDDLSSSATHARSSDLRIWQRNCTRARGRSALT